MCPERRASPCPKKISPPSAGRPVHEPPMILSWPCVLCGADFRRCDAKALSCCASCRKSGRTDGTARHARSGGGEFLFRDVARRRKPPHTIGGILHSPSAGIKTSGGILPSNGHRHPAKFNDLRPPSGTKTMVARTHSRSPSCAARDVISAGINSKEQNTAVL